MPLGSLPCWREERGYETRSSVFWRRSSGLADSSRRGWFPARHVSGDLDGRRDHESSEEDRRADRVLYVASVRVGTFDRSNVGAIEEERAVSDVSVKCDGGVWCAGEDG